MSTVPDQQSNRLFSFDVTLVASLKVPAQSETEAFTRITGALSQTRATLGHWPDGSPIVSEISTDPRGLDISPCHGVEAPAPALVHPSDDVQVLVRAISRAARKAGIIDPAAHEDLSPLQCLVILEDMSTFIGEMNVQGNAPAQPKP